MSLNQRQRAALQQQQAIVEEQLVQIDEKLCMMEQRQVLLDQQLALLKERKAFQERLLIELKLRLDETEEDSENMVERVLKTVPLQQSIPTI